MTKTTYSHPTINDKEIKNAVISFLTGKWLPSGENVNRFERRFSKKFNHLDYMKLIFYIAC